MANLKRSGLPSSDDMTYTNLSDIEDDMDMGYSTGSKGGQSSTGKKTKGTSRRGFASMDKAKQREIASKGGQASGGNFKNDPERARAAGRIGGSR